MEQHYSFDPYNWATIAPYYEALIDAHDTSDGFVAWLNTWNGLEIAVHDAWTQLKRPAYYDTRDLAAEQHYQAFSEHMFSTHLGLTNRLIDRALAVHSEAPTPQLQQLWRRWRNQRSLFDPASLPLHAGISRLDGRYREIMRRYDGSVEAPLAYWMERRTELNELLLEVLALRRRLARTCGVPTFLEYRWRELNRLDYSIAACQAFHRAVEHVVVPAVQRLRDSAPDETHMPAFTDPAALTAGVGRIVRTVDTTFGDLWERMRAGYLDIGHRDGKAPAVEEWFFPGTGLPYLHVASTNLGSVLHETGHGMHDALSFQAQRYLWNTGGPDEFQEFAATSFDLLCWPYYDQAHGGVFSASESAAAHRSVLRFYLHALAESVREDAFEHWVYGDAPEDVTPTQLDAKWLELSRRLTPWKTFASQAEAETGWQRWTWSLFRMPLYMITYPTAIVATCQFGHLAATDRGRAIDQYGTTLALGNTQPLPELFQSVGVTFPFAPQAVGAAVDFVHEQWASSASA